MKDMQVTCVECRIMCTVEASHISVAEFCSNVDILYLVSFSILHVAFLFLQPFLLYFQFPCCVSFYSSVIYSYDASGGIYRTVLTVR